MPPANATEKLLQLDSQLCFAVYSTSLAMTRLYKQPLGELGLTYPQYLVMLALWEGDGATVSELGQKLSLDSGTLTPLLKRLESVGMLTRLRDAADERRVRVTLTAPGHEMKSRAARVPECMLAASQCSIDELVGLTRQLQALRDQLKAAA
jgi:DNA-binding MarR family transcriptional regulator